MAAHSYVARYISSTECTLIITLLDALTRAFYGTGAARETPLRLLSTSLFRGSLCDKDKDKSERNPDGWSAIRQAALSTDGVTRGKKKKKSANGPEINK